MKNPVKNSIGILLKCEYIWQTLNSLLYMGYLSNHLMSFKKFFYKETSFVRFIPKYLIFLCFVAVEHGSFQKFIFSNGLLWVNKHAIKYTNESSILPNYFNIVNNL